MMKRLQLQLLASEPGGQKPPPSRARRAKAPTPSGIEGNPSPSKGLESLFPTGPHGFSDLPTVLLLYGKNSL